MSKISDEFGLALAKELCPICAKEIDGPIVMGTIMSKKKAQKINELTGKVIGWAKKPCSECQEHIDNGCFFVIGIDIEKSNDEGLYRSGHLVGIKRDSDFVKSLSDKEKEHNAIYMDYREMIRLGIIRETV